MAEETRNGPGESEASGPTELELEKTQASQAGTTDTEERARTRHSAPANGSGSAGRALLAAALVVALAALGVSLYVLLKKPWTEDSSASETTTTAPPGPSPQQVTDAKANACGAFNLVSTAVNGRANAAPGTEPEAAGANARLATTEGAAYLLQRVDAATPAALADAIRRYAANIQEVGMASLAGIGADDPAQAGRINEWPALTTQISDLCK